MAYSSATVLVFVCVAIMAATTPSTAQLIQVPVNLSGTLSCGNTTGVVPVLNNTVQFACGTLSGALMTVQRIVNITGNGTITGLITINLPILLTAPLNLLDMILESVCVFLAPSQICSGILPGLNTTTMPLLAASVNATVLGGLGVRVNISPASGFQPINTLFQGIIIWLNEGCMHACILILLYSSPIR